MDDWYQDVDLMGHGIGLESGLLAHADGAGPSHNYGAPPPSGNGDGGDQRGQSYAPPVCVIKGSDCQASMFWRQRCEQVMTESNQRMVSMNNHMAEINRLTTRLTQAEKSIRMYQQRLVDTLNSMEPVKKELDDVKNQLLAEMRERSRYQCEAESVKAASAQLQAFISNHEDKASALRDQITQLQVKETEKASEAKKFQEKASIFEAKYRKVKEELKTLREESVRLRRYAENGGLGMTQRGFRGRAFLGRNSARFSGQRISHGSSSDDDNYDSGLMAEQLETELTCIREERLKPDSSPESPLPSTRVQARTGTVPLSSQSQAGLCTKAMAILKRKEREEAEGTYAGGAKKLFCASGRRSVHPPAPLPRADLGLTRKRVNSAITVVSVGTTLTQDSSSTGQLTAEEALSRVFLALKDVREKPPLSPIPDLPPGLPFIACNGEPGKGVLVERSSEVQAYAAELDPLPKESSAPGKEPVNDNASIGGLLTGEQQDDTMALPPIIPSETASNRISGSELGTHPLSTVHHSASFQDRDQNVNAGAGFSSTPNVQPPNDLGQADSHLLNERSDGSQIDNAVALDAVPIGSAVAEEEPQADAAAPTADLTMPGHQMEVVADTSFGSIDGMSNLIIASGDDEEPTQSASTATASQDVSCSPMETKGAAELVKYSISGVEEALMLDEATVGEESTSWKNEIRASSFAGRVTLEKQPTRSSETLKSVFSSPPYVGSSLVISEDGGAGDVGVNFKAKVVSDVGNKLLPITDATPGDMLLSQVETGASTTTISDRVEVANVKAAALSLPELEFPAKKKRGRPRLKPPPPKAPLSEAAGKSPGPRRSRHASGGARLRPPATEEAEKACKRVSLKSFKDNRGYAAILDSMLSGAGMSPVSALEKWMKKPKLPAETVAYCFIEAVKRHNSVPWIATQFKMGFQTEPSRRLFHSFAKKADIGFQVLPANDKKLADLLDCLLSQDTDAAEWKSAPDIMLSQIKWQLGSTSSQEMNAIQREALCRWIFYLCKRRSSRAKVNIAKETLLIMVRRDYRSQATQQTDQGTLNVFLTLAMVWPPAFKKTVTEARGETGRILQAVFRSLLRSSSSSSKAERLLEQFVGQWDAAVPGGHGSSFDLLIREQLAHLSDLSAPFEVTETGVRPPLEFTTCVQKFCLLAPYCGEQSIALFAESSLISIVEWHCISTEDASARGGVNKLVADILLVSNVALFYQAGIRKHFDGVLNSLKSMVFDVESNENAFCVEGRERALLIGSAVELLTSLPASLCFGQVGKVDNLLKELVEELEKVTTLRKEIKLYYRKCHTEFCVRRKLKAGNDAVK